MAWVTIPDTDVDQDSPVTVALMTALRDNIEGAADGDTGSPVFGLTKLATATASASSSIDFVTPFDSTRYESYLFVISDIYAGANVTLNVRTSTDGGSTYDAGAGNYDYSDTTEGVGGGVAGTYIPITGSLILNSATLGGCNGVFELFNPDGVAYTFARWQTAFYSSTAITSATVGGGARLSSADVDAIRFFPTSSTLTDGKITMYGRARL